MSEVKEIKFRGWNKEKKGMIDLKSITPFAIDPKLQEETDGLFIPFSKDMILMQYIGRTDKNGVKIYEGDVVKSKAENIHSSQSCNNVVYFDVRDLKFSLADTKNYHRYMNGLAFDWGGWEEHEVIGNIYQNPELIERENV